MLGSNSKTVQYIEPNITIEPLFILADPRGNGTKEWFAVVTNNSKAQITAYAQSTGSAVSTYFTKNGTVVPFNNIVTTLMTNMSELFKNATTFNEDISSWDTRIVTDMTRTFQTALGFNQPLNYWNVANVTNTFKMFDDAHIFNQPLNNWNVANVTSMSAMFNGARAFNQNISLWNVDNVTSMIQMFYDARVFNQNISGWNVGNVTNMAYMFSYATVFNQNLSGWNVGKVTSRDNFASPALLANVAFQPNWPKLSRLANGVTIQYTGTAQAVTDEYNLSTPSPLFVLEDPRGTGTPELFAIVNNSSRQKIIDYAKSTGSAVSTYFTKLGESSPVPFNNIVTTLMTGMRQLFSFTTINKDISSWDTSNVTDMAGMFTNNGLFNQDISKWNVAKVTDMSSLFINNYKFNQNISSWNTSNVILMSYMFSGTLEFNQNINGWNVANVTNMSYTFAYTKAFNQPLSSWNVAKVSVMSSMFVRAAVFNQPLNTWNVANVFFMEYMFSEAIVFNQPLNSWNVAKVTNMSRMFFNPLNYPYIESVFNQNLSGWNVAYTTARPSLMRIKFAVGSVLGRDENSAFLPSWAGPEEDILQVSRNVGYDTNANDNKLLRIKFSVVNRNPINNTKIFLKTYVTEGYVIPTTVYQDTSNPNVNNIYYAIVNFYPVNNQGEHQIRTIKILSADGQTEFSTNTNVNLGPEYS
ncbi:BspA family leucine-rich repeat surface protein [bacterium]|nr:BspA family leucine-rich repeat surface protein [bacterium]